LADPPVNGSGDQEARRDSVHPDPLGHDDDILTQSETLDEDDMGVDPLEGGWILPKIGRHPTGTGPRRPSRPPTGVYPPEE
jgi:hypothetical protein